jgi:hypothetical protein
MTETPEPSAIGFRKPSAKRYAEDLAAVTPDVERFFDAWTWDDTRAAMKRGRELRAARLKT